MLTLSSEAGAGIRVPPNSSRLLLRWGVDLEAMKKSVSRRYHFVRWEDGSTIVELPFDNIVETHGAPYYLVHRADLHSALLAAARRAGVTVRTGKRVVGYDFEAPSATTQDGEVFRANLVIAADGIKSVARPLLTGRPDAPRDTGDVAYRILIPGRQLLADPELAGLITDPCTTSWCGPDAHLVGYPIRGGELYNVVVCATAQHNETTDAAWVVRGDNRELAARFAGWEPRVRKLCALTGAFMKWRLCDLAADLPRWAHPAGRAALLGDSCHPMLPYLAQGAAQSFEDAATLRRCLALDLDPGEALRRYEQARMPRASLVQAKTREHQYILHIADGEEQRARDRRLQLNAAENPIFWGHDERRKWLFGHDAEVLGAEGANWQMAPQEASVAAH